MMQDRESLADQLADHLGGTPELVQNRGSPTPGVKRDGEVEQGAMLVSVSIECVFRCLLY